MEDIKITVDLGDRPDAEAVLVHWIFDKGAAVKAGEVVAEAMLDKVTLSIEAPAAGYLVPTVETNGVFRSGQAIGRIAAHPPDNSSVSVPPSSGDREHPENRDGTEFIPVAPAVRRYAKEKGVDLAEVAAAFPGRRLTVADVEAFKARPGNKEAMEPFSPARRVLIQHLTDPLALPTTLHRRIAAGNPDMTPLARIAWAVGQALARHPRLHGWATAEGFIPAHTLTLGIATDTPAGLMVPVLRAEAEPQDWARALATLRDAVRRQALDTLDFSRPSFVLSNLGPWGIEYFTPRLMVPTVAVLGVGASSERSFPVSLTFDHRVVDGAEAANFLRTLDTLLQWPAP